MEGLFYNISQVLGITIIHSLWQGLIVYIALRLFMLAFVKATASTKYHVSYAAMFMMLVWFTYTLFKESAQYNWLSVTPLTVSPIALPFAMHEAGYAVNSYYFAIAGYMPYLVMLYLAGLAFNTLKLTLAWNSIYRIRKNVSPAGFDRVIKELSQKLVLHRSVKAVFSEWVDVPCITGFIKPIILLPLSITCHLSAEEIEAVLLHELAHVKRNDYLLNFIQQVIGIILFFNPFARLITKLINEDRENCCDDIVVHVTGSPFIYAQALLKLEENKQNEWQLALAATGKKYELLNRIERIMKTKTQTINIRPVLITLLALVCSISSIAWLNPEIKNGKVGFKNIVPTVRVLSAIVAGPAKSPITTPEKAINKHKSKPTISIYADTTGVTGLNDTTIKSKKVTYKIVAVDENGNKKEYNSVNDLPAADRAGFYQVAADMKFKTIDSANISAMKKFYSGDQWKKQQVFIQKQADLLTKKFSSKAWKKDMQKMQKQAAQMVKKYNGPEFKKQQELFAMQNEKMAKKFADDPKWKEQQEDMVKIGKEMADKFTNDPEWKKQQEEFAKMGKEIGEQFAKNPEWKKQQEEMAKMGEEMAKKFADKAEFKKQQTVIKKEVKKERKEVEKVDKLNKERKQQSEDQNKKDAPEQQ